MAQVRDLAKKAVHTITLTQKGGVPATGIGLKFSAKNKYGATICSFESNNWPSFAHKHNLSLSGNSITVGSASGKTGCDISNAAVIKDLVKRVSNLESHTHKLSGSSVLAHTHGLDAKADLTSGSVSGSATSRSLNVSDISTGKPL